MAMEADDDGIECGLSPLDWLIKYEPRPRSTTRQLTKPPNTISEQKAESVHPEDVPNTSLCVKPDGSLCSSDDECPATETDQTQQTRKEQYSKPNVSYVNLIAKALLASPDHKCTLRDIYDHIKAEYPYFKTCDTEWKNCVRHNLSLNTCFVRLLEDGTNARQIKGAAWTFAPDAAQYFAADGSYLKPGRSWNTRHKANTRRRPKSSSTAPISSDTQDSVFVDVEPPPAPTSECAQPAVTPPPSTPPLTPQALVNEKLSLDVSMDPVLEQAKKVAPMRIRRSISTQSIFSTISTTGRRKSESQAAEGPSLSATCANSKSKHIKIELKNSVFEHQPRASSLAALERAYSTPAVSPYAVSQTTMPRLSLDSIPCHRPSDTYNPMPPDFRHSTEYPISAHSFDDMMYMAATANRMDDYLSPLPPLSDNPRSQRHEHQWDNVLNSLLMTTL